MFFYQCTLLILGIFEEEFIEQRREALEQFVNK